MTSLAELVDRYLPDLVNKHGSQLLPGQYQALHAFRRCRNQHSRGWCWNAVIATTRHSCHTPAAIAAVPVAYTTKASNGWNDRRQNCWRLAIL